MSEPSRGRWLLPAVVGGTFGAMLTALVLLVAAPQWLGPRMVREGLLADPQVLADAADALRDRQTAPLLASHRAALETPFASSWKGAEKPDVVLVEFFDYACGYCKASLPHVEQLLREDKGLRVVYREFPILGPDSVAAARVSLAASKAGRFKQYHDALYQAGRPGPQTIAAAARAANLPAAVPDSADIEAELKRNFQLASQLGASGTPTFVVGNRVLHGAAGYAELKKAIADARRKS
ncbi:MAG TPA: DsbA family protein [Sphingomicrobium sp.]|nr:DsbA family protein [Sphingomicrobium sp.]